MRDEICENEKWNRNRQESLNDRAVQRSSKSQTSVTMRSCRAKVKSKRLESHDCVSGIEGLIGAKPNGEIPLTQPAASGLLEQ